MPSFLADEDVDGCVVRALWRRLPGMDLPRAQDTELMAQEDDAVLAWAAEAGRIVISRDRNTMTKAAYQRIARRLPMPGLLVLRAHGEMPDIVASLELVLHASSSEEWADKVAYIPLS